MSFEYLPLPLFLALTTGIALLLGFSARKTWNSEPKPLSLGYFFVGFSSFIVGLNRLAKSSVLLGNGSWVLSLLLGLFGTIGTILIFIGAYIKAKGDPVKEKFVIRIIASVFFLLIIGGIAVVYALFFL